MPLVKWASLSAFAVWENVITSKEWFLVICQSISKLGAIKECSSPNGEKLLSLHTLPPGVLQTMSSHLLSDSSSSARQLDLTGPHIRWLWLFLYFHLHIYTYILYAYMPSEWFCPFWPFLIMTRKFLSPDQNFSPGLIHIQLQVLSFDPHAFVYVASLPRTPCHVRLTLKSRLYTDATLPSRLRDTGVSVPCYTNTPAIFLYM